MKVAVGLRRVAAGKRTSGRRAAQIALGVIHFLSGSRSCKSYALISHLESLLLYLITPKSHVGGDESNEYNFK